MYKASPAPSFDELDQAVAVLKALANGWVTAGERVDAVNAVAGALQPFRDWATNAMATSIVGGHQADDPRTWTSPELMG